MKSIEMDVGELRDILAKNRERHQKTFSMALAGYKKAVIEALDKALEEAREGKAYRTFFHLPMPESHIDDYDQAMEMLEHHQGETVEVESRDYDRFVRDNWEWRREFLGTASTYGAVPVAQGSD